jgi:hypothetical protein
METKGHGIQRVLPSTTRVNSGDAAVPPTQRKSMVRSMAVDPTAPKVDRFISQGGEPYLILHNSRMPVLVYTLRGIAIR